MKSVKSACHYRSEKVKWYKSKGNIGANDNHPMHRSADYGHDTFRLSFDQCTAKDKYLPNNDSDI